MRKFQLEKYFDNDLYLVRFNNIQDLEKRFKEDENLNIVDFSFRSDYDNDFSDYELNLTVEDFTTTLPDIQKILDKYEITIKKIRNNQKDDKKSKDVNLVFRYHKDTNINSVFTEISALENVIDLEEA